MSIASPVTKMKHIVAYINVWMHLFRTLNNKWHPSQLQMICNVCICRIFGRIYVLKGMRWMLTFKYLTFVMRPSYNYHEQFLCITTGNVCAFHWSDTVWSVMRMPACQMIEKPMHELISALVHLLVRKSKIIKWMHWLSRITNRLMRMSLLIILIIYASYIFSYIFVPWTYLVNLECQNYYKTGCLDISDIMLQNTRRHFSSCLIKYLRLVFRIIFRVDLSIKIKPPTSKMFKTRLTFLQVSWMDSVQWVNVNKQR